MTRETRGLWYGVGAYTAWGVVPLYWKLIGDVPVQQIIGHRIVWSAALLFAWIAATGQWGRVHEALRRPGVLRTYAVAALLIGINWCTFLWAVVSRHIVDTSLGYFINPLLSVLLGVVVLGERLRAAQWVAVALAAGGVLFLTVMHGRLPWISLLLATTFALYALVKKRAPLGAVLGLTLEVGLLTIPALGFLLASEFAGEGAFLHSPPPTDTLLFGAGAITIAPLLMFAYAAQRIPMLWLGILQYVAPTLQLAIGVLVFGEPFSSVRLAGFSAVWAALLLFAVEGLLVRRSAVVVPPPE